eukprot:11134629-Heterocapsa_arctica.AAC.1
MVEERPLRHVRQRPVLLRHVRKPPCSQGRRSKGPVGPAAHQQRDEQLAGGLRPGRMGEVKPGKSAKQIFADRLPQSSTAWHWELR